MCFLKVKEIKYDIIEKIKSKVFKDIFTLDINLDCHSDLKYALIHKVSFIFYFFKIYILSIVNFYMNFKTQKSVFNSRRTIIFQ